MDMTGVRQARTQRDGEAGPVSEFRAFIERGNVVDMAVAVVMALAFGKVVTSFVNDLLMPPIGLLLGGTDFGGLFVALDGVSYATLAAARAAGAPILAIGSFLNVIIEFALVALGVFLIVRTINQYHLPEAPAAIATKECPRCISTISDRATRCPACTSELAPTLSTTWIPERAPGIATGVMEE